MNDVDVFEDISNPLDSVEEILCANDWVFDRATDDELLVQVSGKHCVYTLDFIWHEDKSAMSFTAHIDINFTDDNLDEATRALCAINSSLWLGHFDIDPQTNSPRFRNTSLFRGMNYSSGIEHVEELMDIALKECERFYPTFNLLSQHFDGDERMLALSIVDSAGQA